jgi:3'-5' exoribonuclease
LPSDNWALATISGVMDRVSNTEGGPDNALLLDITQARTAGPHNEAAILLEHVVGLMELVLVVAPRYPRLDQDKLLLGAFLHDAAKVAELSHARDIAYTDDGQLLGHMVLAMTMIDDKVREAERLSGEPFPKPLVTEIKHMVISHHGEYEYGSPKLPMTLEAVALHHLDNLDAKLASFTQLMIDCPNVESNWTQYHTNLGRKLYKGSGVRVQGSEGN